MKVASKIIIALLAPLLVWAEAFAAVVSVSVSSVSLNVGETKTFTVSAPNAAGRIDISSANNAVASVSTSSVFLDQNSANVTINAVSAGSTTITISSNSVTDYDTVEETTYHSIIAVTVSAPTPAPAPDPTPTPTPQPSNNQSATSRTTTETKIQEESKQEEMQDIEEDGPGEIEDEDLVYTEPLGVKETKQETCTENIFTQCSNDKATMRIYSVAWPILFLPYMLLTVLLIIVLIYFIRKYKNNLPQKSISDKIEKVNEFENNN